jgi:hypothetical protein
MVERHAITIFPDFSRRLPQVDPDDHHLFVSLGCAAENLAQAAAAHGLLAAPMFDTSRQGVHIPLTRSSQSPIARPSPLFTAIAARQCTRGDYDGLPVTDEELRLLQQAGSSSRVSLRLVTERSAIEQVLALIVQANTVQVSDAGFVNELKQWIRFNPTEAARMRDGLFSVSSGNPSIPTWLGELAFGWFFTRDGENDKIIRQVRSSAGIAVFTGAVTDKAHWVEVGRCYQRFALQATALGIRNAFLNQPVEVPSVRPLLATALGLERQRPDLLVRFGRGPGLPRSLRRPIEDVLI